MNDHDSFDTRREQVRAALSAMDTERHRQRRQSERRRRRAEQDQVTDRATIFVGGVLAGFVLGTLIGVGIMSLAGT